MLQLIYFILTRETGADLRKASSPQSAFEKARLSGWSNHPDDAGGPTMCGVTLATYRAWCRQKKYPAPSAEDLREIIFTHWEAIFRKNFWDYCRASQIKAEPVAWIIVDWVWASGPKVIKRVQRMLALNPDGIIGPKTLAAINAEDPASLFSRLRGLRLRYIDEICAARPANNTFRRGWLRRLDAIQYGFLDLTPP